MEQRKDSWTFTVRHRDTVLAILTICPYDNDAIIHNEVFVWNRYLAKIYREMFNDIRGVLRESGVSLAIAVSDCFTDKIGKYWRLMGYEVFGDCEYNGNKIRYAVMEA
jgi:hypothetical protein